MRVARIVPCVISGWNIGSTLPPISKDEPFPLGGNATVFVSWPAIKTANAPSTGSIFIFYRGMALSLSFSLFSSTRDGSLAIRRICDRVFIQAPSGEIAGNTTRSHDDGIRKLTRRRGSKSPRANSHGAPNSTQSKGQTKGARGNSAGTDKLIIRLVE